MLTRLAELGLEARLWEDKGKMGEKIMTTAEWRAGVEAPSHWAAIHCAGCCQRAPLPLQCYEVSSAALALVCVAWQCQAGTPASSCWSAGKSMLAVMVLPGYTATAPMACQDV